MFASFTRLGQRDMKRLAKNLHAMLAAGAPADLPGCRDLVARLHGHASWNAARLAEQPALRPARLDMLGTRLDGGLLERGRPFRLAASLQRTPRLVLGASGSGRTASLLGMFKAAIDNGLGGIYVDANGDPGQAYLQVSAFAELAGRRQDLRVINLM